MRTDFLCVLHQSRQHKRAKQTLQPLEEILANEFNLSEFVVCTDAGLASINNRQYNTTEGRNYIVTQSIPGLPKLMKEWYLEKTGWRRLGDKEDRTYDISDIDLESEKEHLYYHERWFKEDRSNVKNYEERLIVTFSPSSLCISDSFVHSTLRKR